MSFEGHPVTEIAKNLKSIGDGAFASNGLTELVIPPSVTAIGQSLASGYNEAKVKAWTNWNKPEKQPRTLYVKWK